MQALSRRMQNWAVETAQWIMCLLHKHDNLSLLPSTHVQVRHFYNHTAGRQRLADSSELTGLSQSVSSGFTDRPCLKKMRKQPSKTSEIKLWPPCAHMPPTHEDILYIHTKRTENKYLIFAVCKICLKFSSLPQTKDV